MPGEAQRKIGQPWFRGREPKTLGRLADQAVQMTDKGGTTDGISDEIRACVRACVEIGLTEFGALLTTFQK